MELVKNGATLLPFVAFSGLLVAGWRSSRCWRASFIASATLWGIWVAVTTELFSFSSILTRNAVAWAWLLASILSWSLAIAASKYQRLFFGLGSGQSRAATSDGRLSQSDWLLPAGLATMVMSLGVVAFVAPPNTWDAMQYNMPRVVMWIENHSVHFYPTVDYQQLMMSPWTEYAMTHLSILHGDDRLVNMVEFFAFVGSIIGVSLIARELGSAPRGQLLAAIFCGTIPQAILAATSSKPDVAVAFWIVVSFYFLLRLKTAPTWSSTALAGAAMGLAIMTKGTAFILLPAVALAAFWIWHVKNWRRLLSQVGIVLLIVLALNGPQFYRNVRLSGSPLGFASPDGDADTEGQRHFANGKFGVRDISGNVLRSIALHLETPNNRINAWTTERFRQLIRAIGIDPDDQKMIEQGNAGEVYAFNIPRASRSEVLAGNCLHLILFLLSAALLALNRKPGERDVAILAIGVIGAFVLFCAAVRWQPYNGRFHLPAFMLGCAVMSRALTSRIPRWGLLLTGALALLGAMPYALSNEMRPLVGIRYFHGFRPDRTPDIFATTRDHLYFGDQHLYLADSYEAVAHAVAASGCRDIGLDSFLLHYDYPMLALLRAGMGGPTVRYVHVRNRSAIYDRTSASAPCAIICLGCAPARQKWKEYSGSGVVPLQIDRTVVFISAASRTAKAVGISGAGIAEISRSEILNRTYNPNSREDSSHACDLLPENAVRNLLGGPVKHSLEGAVCRYTNAAGQIEIEAFPPNSYYSRDFATLAAEGMGSLQFRVKDFAITVVLDQGSPELAYLHKGQSTFSLNIDRNASPATAKEYIQLGELLSANLR